MLLNIRRWNENKVILIKTHFIRIPVDGGVRMPFCSTNAAFKVCKNILKE